MSRRIEENISSKADGEHMYVKTVAQNVSPKANGSHTDVDIGCIVRSPEAYGEHTDVKTDWTECKSRSRWRTPGAQDGLERTQVQRLTDWTDSQCRPMANTVMPRRLAQNASPEGDVEHTDAKTGWKNASQTPMANTRMSTRSVEKARSSAGDEHTDVNLTWTERKSRE
jgi:hypothetical protein